MCGAKVLQEVSKYQPGQSCAYALSGSSRQPAIRRSVSMFSVHVMVKVAQYDTTIEEKRSLVGTC